MADSKKSAFQDAVALHEAWADHSRLFEQNKWVYPVISRRAGGLSVGINLNPDKSCSFRCAYCQVDRTIPGKHFKLNLKELEFEIVTLIEEYKKNGLSDFSNFKNIYSEHRQIQDLCLSGDGESTLVPEFAEVCHLMRQMQERYREFNIRLTLITNATHLCAPNVWKGLETLTSLNGEIWGKLDAGTENFYKQINDSAVSLETIQSNLESVAQKFPLRIQTMVCKVGTFYLDEVEQKAYMERLRKIQNAAQKVGRQILGIQLYGVVRHTACSNVEALPIYFLENLAEKINVELQIPVSVY